MLLRTIFAFLFLLFVPCSCETERAKPQPPSPSPPDTPRIGSVQPDSPATVRDTAASELERSLLAAGLVDVQQLDSSIVIDLRYSTTDNFLGFDVYGDFDRCFLQPDVAEKLVKAQSLLKKKYPYYSLVVYDAVRPLRIQRLMWDTLKLPPGQKQKYLSNPANGSLHNFGAAVDVGIIDENNIPLDFGTKYDYFGELAHPEKEEQLLDEGRISHRQLLNRELLREVMRKAGFSGIQTEWWHFNACSRAAAKERYKIVE